MLPRLILYVLQIVGALWIAPHVVAAIGGLPAISGYDIEIFGWAVIFAALVFIIGFIGSVVLKGLRTPSVGTLTFALALALIGAALTMVPPVTEAVGRIGLTVERLWWPLAGAMLGYIIKR